MSTGELCVFGACLPRCASLARIPPRLRLANAFLQQREQHKCVLPNQQTSDADVPPCLAVARLLSGSLLLLEDGQVVSLDAFDSWADAGEEWVAAAFEQLNSLRLPLVDVAIGGHRALAPREEAAGLGPRVRSGAAGDTGSHFVALSATGEVFVFGRNEHGQLGLGHTRGPVVEPTRLEKFAPPEPEDPAAGALSNIKLASRTPLPARIVAVSAGRAHSMALTSDGCVYSWGRDMEGQCGLAIGLPGSDALRGRSAIAAHSSTHLSMHVTPRFLQHLQGVRVRALAASNHVSLALDDSGAVWHWGYGLAKGQINAPELVAFEDQAQHVVTSVAVGYSHALMLTDQGEAYSFGLGLTGALGHAFPSSGAAPRLLAARRIAVGDADSDDTDPVRIVQVFAGSYSSALLDSQGQVWTFGSGEGGKLGLDDELAPAGGVNVFEPTLVRSLAAKTVSMLRMDRERLLAFVPTKLSSVSPGVAQLQGGTALEIRGAGFFVLESEGNDAEEHLSSPPSIAVSFSYLGTQVRARGRYDPVEDVLRVVVPDLRAKGADASAGKKSSSGASYRNGHLENCVLRASLDGGRHFSNALKLHVFSPPDFSSSRRKGAPAVLAQVLPPAGPVQGGSELALHARFEAVPYQRILVRFRVLQDDGTEAGAAGADGAGAVIGTVEGEFDPVASCIHCVAPELPVALIPPSVPATRAPLTAPGKLSRFVRPPVVPPPRTLVNALLEVSLDGQQFFRFAAPYAYYAVSASKVTPDVIGVAGADVSLRARGVHYTAPGEQLRLRFEIAGNYHTVEVPARFVPLQAHRDAALAERERVARLGRKRRQEALEAARLAREQAEREEEQNRDPKEKAALEKEKLRAEKAAQAAAEKAASAGSRPGSSGGTHPASRPVSSSGAAGRRPSSRGGLSTAPRDASPAAPARPGTAERMAPAAGGAPESSEDGKAAASSSSSSVEQDEWSVLEARISAEEAAEDASLALLSAADRDAEGFIEARAPLFTDFGACSPSISVTLNGRDFTPLHGVKLQVSRPVPTALSPSCGPIGGGTVVELRGEHFYYTNEIQVQLRPVQTTAAAAATTAAGGTPTSPPGLSSAAVASAATAAAAGSAASSVPGSAHKPKSASGSKPKPGAADAESTTPLPIILPPQTPQTVSSEFVAHGADPLSASTSTDAGLSSLRFHTPAWNAPGTTSVHAAFDPSANSFSAGTGLLFRFYEPALVTEAHPLLVSQAGGTEVTLHGRGFLQSDCIKVRLVLAEEAEDSKKPHGGKTAAAAAHAEVGSGDATPAATGRRKSFSKLMPGVDAALAAHSNAAVAAAVGAGDSAPAAVPHLDVVATRDAHDSPAEEEEHARLLAQRAKKGSKSSSSSGGKKGEDIVEPEAATLSFVVPAASAFSQAFVEGSPVSAANRALEVELALNGQQFAPTGIVLRFEKDNKKAVGAAGKPKLAGAGATTSSAAASDPSKKK